MHTEKRRPRSLLKLLGCKIFERIMRLLGSVLDTPRLDQEFCLIQRQKPVFVQAFKYFTKGMALANYIPGATERRHAEAKLPRSGKALGFRMPVEPRNASLR